MTECLKKWKNEKMKNKKMKKWKNEKRKMKKMKKMKKYFFYNDIKTKK